jgi:hypothetical protein
MIRLMPAPPPTLKERIALLQARTGLNLGKLEKKAGLTPNHLRTILADPQRTQLKGETAYRLALAARASLGWVTTGLGSIDAADVPHIPLDQLKKARLEDLPSWVATALGAIEREKGKLDWAVMAVGEEPIKMDSLDVTEYFVLHEAEKIAKAVDGNFEERQRLDKKLREFMAKHAGSRRHKSKVEPPHNATTQKRDR